MNFYCHFSTESFGKKGAELLSSKLKDRYGETFPIYKKTKDKDQFFIKASTSAAQAVLKEIKDLIIEIGMARKYNSCKDIDLNISPKIGRREIIRPDLIDLILSFDEFSIPQLKLSNINAHDIQYYIDKLYVNRYLYRYVSEDKYNLYHYKLTDSGKKYFLKIAGA